MADWQRTHSCGELRAAHIGQTITLNGWVNTTRVYNDQVFIDLRDRYGLTQVVCEADHAEVFRLGSEVRSEWVLSVTGIVRPRQPGKTNAKLATGEVEVQVTHLRVLNRCPNPPFEVYSVPQADGTFSDPELANEDLRLQWRFLDMRRPTLQRALALRHRLNKTIRDHLDENGFLEIETPLLGRSTPEGARDYLVPSRIHPGSWYALPQSPQLYKQLSMVAGFDRYYQIARCLRDEDLRADRQPEFTQLDVEMSFVEMDDVLAAMEKLVATVFRHLAGVEIPLPLPRLRYDDAMMRYGSDKPDLRYGLEIVDVSDLAAQSEFRVFQEVLAEGGVVRCLNARGAGKVLSNTDLKPGGKLNDFTLRAGGKGLAYLKAEAGKLGGAGSIEKFIPATLQTALSERMGVQPGDVLLFVADQPEVTSTVMGALRQHLAGLLKLVDPTRREFQLAWVVDFPSFLWDAEENRWVANHHPFTAVQDAYLDILRNATEADLTNPRSPLAGVKAKAYDIVCNGYELGGGSIRVHDPEVQGLIFRVLGMSPEQARARFGFLLDALRHGAPPHGGIAFGMDRWAMILAGTTNIRDVIAFPKNQRARDLMTGAPAPVDPRQLKELGL